MTSRASASFMRSIVIFLMITSRPPTAVTTCLGLDAGGGHEALDRLGDDARVHDLALDDRVVHHRGERDLGQRPARREPCEMTTSLISPLPMSRPTVVRVAPEQSHT